MVTRAKTTAFQVGETGGKGEKQGESSEISSV